MNDDFIDVPESTLRRRAYSRNVHKLCLRCTIDCWPSSFNLLVHRPNLILLFINRKIILLTLIDIDHNYDKLQDTTKKSKLNMYENVMER